MEPNTLDHKAPTIGDYAVLLKAPDGGNQEDIKRLLYYCLNRGNLVALCGAGCSMTLGYGDWKRLAHTALDKSSAEAEERERLRPYIDEPDGYITLRSFLSYLENLESKTDEELGRVRFRKEIQDHFRAIHNENRKLKKTGRIYQELINLDIRRFVTTNFDLEIEAALVEEHKTESRQLLHDKTREWIKPFPPEDLTPFTSYKSFSQRPDCMEQLSLFSLAGNKTSDHMVFHCHGRVDDIDSCVLTEADYRRWYLQDTLSGKAFRQTMDLLFGANPLLVIGYSLHDPELGQILRTVHAKRANDPRRSPLFLLLYLDGEEKKITDQCLALNEEYGAYVIPVSGPRTEIEKVTLKELRAIRSGWQQWRERISEKPIIRSFMPTSSQKSTSYYHYLYTDLKSRRTGKNAEQSPPVALVLTEAHRRLKNEMFNLLRRSKSKVKCAVLVGKAGSGKTWSMQRVGLDWLGGRKPEKTRRRVFFWSTYYSNDLYNGLKRAIKFFRRSSIPHVQSAQIMPLFKDVLRREKNALLIFDGIERLLKQSKHLARENRIEAGKAINLDVEKFFKMILERTGEGAFVVVTSRIIPAQFAEPIAKQRVRLLGEGLKVDDELLRRRPTDSQPTKEDYFVDPINAGDYSPLKTVSTECRWGALKSLDETERVLLSASLSGHLYSICLVERILAFTGDRPAEDTTKASRDSEAERREMLRSLMMKIARTPTDRRRERVVREAIKAADEGKAYEESDHNLLERFIERLALFMGPVERPALKICLSLAIGDRNSKSMDSANKDSDKDVNTLDPELLENVIRDLRKRALLLEIQFNNIKASGFTVHSLVQSYVRKYLHRSAFSIHPSMILPGYTSDFDVVDPGSGKDRAKELFSSLCEAADKPPSGSTKRDAGASVRAAFGVLRSRFCSNTVSRWGNYHEYLQMVYRLRDAAMSSTTRHWSQAETIDSQSGIYADKLKKETPTTPPLYLGEFAWLQNEAGLATYTEGNMLDAMFMRQQSSEINSLLDGRLPGFHKFQSYFNVGSVFIDLGNLFHARRYLDDAMLIANAREEKPLKGRVLGYIGLLAYLQGNFEDALRDLRLAINLVKSNARAKSVFLTFLGELLLSLKKNAEALEANERGRALAEGAHYPDLIAYAQLGTANVLREQNDHVRAKREYEVVWDKARHFGLRRLEAGVLTGLSHWAYGLHDSEAACRYALNALTIANEASLGLHQTECLLALGNALMLANQINLGKAYLETARRLAKDQGYFLRSTDAEAALNNVEEAPIAYKNNVNSSLLLGE